MNKLDYRQLPGYNQRKKWNAIVHKVTAEMAEYWIENYRFKGQRPIRDSVVDRYRVEMAAGKWGEGSTITLAIYDGNCYIINGNHRLWGQMCAEVDIHYTIKIVRCATEEELSFLYGVEDDNEVRGTHDRLRAGGTEAQSGLSEFQFRHSIPAIKLMKAGFKRPGRRWTREAENELGDIIIEFAPEISQFFDDITGGEMFNRMKKASLLSIAIITYRCKPELASEFWSQVSRDDGIAKDDPRKAANRFITKHTTRGAGDYNMSDMGYAQAMAQAWKSFSRGKKMVRISNLSSDDNLKVYGTPWDASKDDCGMGELMDYTPGGRLAIAAG